MASDWRYWNDDPMTKVPEYLSNKASPAEIAVHLSQCDAHFVPSLSARVKIEDYANKIATQATRFEAWSGGNLVGLAAAYCNDQETRVAYLTNVSVLREWMGKGVAESLLSQCFKHAAAAGMRQVSMEVGEGNTPAIKLYKKFGFVAGNENGAFVGMTLNLKSGEANDKQA